MIAKLIGIGNWALAPLEKWVLPRGGVALFLERPPEKSAEVALARAPREKMPPPEKLGEPPGKSEACRVLEVQPGQCRHPHAALDLDPHGLGVRCVICDQRWVATDAW